MNRKVFSKYIRLKCIPTDDNDKLKIVRYFPKFIRNTLKFSRKTKTPSNYIKTNNPFP